ncbi:MAG: 2OG-Fe(II) oxygenase [Alphaproteobacteria bacterium]|nr:MAG: 2OG-Fe(II) oxygenase [Alphaproteobacteria bacterium]
MGYLDLDRLATIDPASFRDQKPFPWLNPAGLLHEDAYRRLVETLPDVSLLKPVFGARRLHGQQSHDRYTLEYDDDLPIADPWKEFAAELRGGAYRDFLARMLGTRAFDLNLHWHYTPKGCSVSPHCDSKRKLGSHIFYFNTEDDWDPAWGGETLVLDDGGRFDPRSAPRFEDFERVIPAQALGNRSLLFARTDRSWHGVREIVCPEGKLRKVFIVVINRRSPVTWIRRKLGLLPRGY